MNKQLMMPFFKERTGAKAAVLLIHSFTASPHEFKELGDYLFKRGLTVSCPIMPGHGTYYRDISKVGKRQWVEHYEKEFLRLKKTYKKVFIIGSSIGVGIAFNLAIKHKVDGIISLGFPYVYKKSHLFKKMQYTNIFKLKFKKVDYLLDVEKADCIKRIAIYQYMPLIGMVKSMMFIKRSKKNLDQVKCPILVMQSTTDHLVTDNSAQLIFDNVGSKDKEIKMMKDMYHVLLADYDSKKIFPAVYDFLKKRL